MYFAESEPVIVIYITKPMDILGPTLIEVDGVVRPALDHSPTASTGLHVTVSLQQDTCDMNEDVSSKMCVYSGEDLRVVLWVL